MVVPVQLTGAQGANGPVLRLDTVNNWKALLFNTGWRDYSVQTATTVGGITNIRIIDWQYKHYLESIFYLSISSFQRCVPR
ncbi:protein of unknown function [Methylocaldum szegediense]|jgi:hypothetical protein|uniref:Uncharacterized protein n=1 Tax=Methylocaldum szegediense TaxID=73780 RepID=A0ABM9HXB5_9GAMM|nr:hypothetical protein [Methylocaldum szegediense]CAI8749708.1 protein of unknown function [Methylocaldum szegediense]